MSEPQLPQGFPAEPAGFPVPMFATAAGALPPRHYSDPLVTAPGLGFSGWWLRVTTTLRELWAPLLGIAVLVALPRFLWDLTVQSPSAKGIGTPLVGYGFAQVLGQVGMNTVVGLLCGGFGTAASVWIMVNRANGRDGAFGGAIAYGLRQLLPIAAWQGLFYLLVGIATATAFALLQCLGGIAGFFVAVPVILVMVLAASVMGALIGPVVAVRASDNPIRMSSDLVRANVGAALGRILLTILIGRGPSILLGVIVSVMIVEVPSMGGMIAVGAVAVVSALGTIWSAVFTPIGLLLTYAELRARSMPMLSPDLLSSMEPRLADLGARDWSN